MMEKKMKLIDLDKLGVGKRNPDAFNDPERAYGWNDLLRILEVAKVVDAVEVVRCKDCKYYVKNTDGLYFGDCMNPVYAIPGAVNPSMKSTDFCSNGERKRNEQSL